MTPELTCTEIRERAFEYRRHELGETTRALVDDHLADCSACHIYLSNIDALLASAGEGDRALTGDGIDGMWDGIAAKLPELSHATRSAGDASAQPVGSRRFEPWWAVAAILTGALLLLGVWRILLSNVDPRPLPTTAPAQVTRDVPEPALLPAPLPAPSMVVPATPPPVVPLELPVADVIAEPLVLAANHPHPALAVFADDRADWSFAEGTSLHIGLDAGTLLIEARPQAGQPLVVEVPDWRIEVIGTVFVVGVENGRSTVSVAAGRVRVTDRDSGISLVLEEGTELGEDGTLTPISASRRALVSAHVDLAAHRVALSSDGNVANPATDEPADRREHSRPDVTPDERSHTHDRQPSEIRDPPPETTATERGDQTSQTIDLAEQALREHRYDDAVVLLEALVDGSAGNDSAASLARLELARLYENQLDQPERALAHLRRFLAEHGDDAAAPSVAREICRLSSALGMPDDNCARSQP